ncbi:MAG TPA: hypothetical protein VGX00_00115 [Thermoplasmata archaeon]|nr:hypothetical protein [Thermoplasmata archaeon]
MTAPPRRIAWIIPPPEICCLCKEPLTQPDESSAWNGNPAHRDCVRIHLLQRDPAFREGEGGEEAPEESSEPSESGLSRDDDESDFG